MTFVIKYHSRRRLLPAYRYATAESLKIGYPEHLRAAKNQPFPEIARVVEGTGRYDHTKLTFYPARSTARWAQGGAGGGNDGVTEPAPAAGIKSAVRVVRESEAALIARKDAEIEELTAALARAKGERAGLVAEAFKRGNVVRLLEAKAAAVEGLGPE